MRYIKFILISICFFIDVLWSECLCMDHPQEKQNAKILMRLIDENEINYHPHSAVLSLKSSFHIGKSLKERTATCFLTGDGFALTAAHAVFHEGVEAHKIECYIGRHGDRLFDSIWTKSVEVKKYVYASSYNWNDKSHERSLNYDYALLYLGEIEEIIKINPIKIAYYYTRPRNDLMICGYPGNEFNDVNKQKNHETAAFPYEAKANYADQSIWTLTLSTPCFGGMSGSPIRFTDDGKIWKAIAILVSNEVYSQNTYGCLLTEKKVKTINAWKNIMLTASDSKEFYSKLEALPFLDKYNLDKGSPYFFSEKEREREREKENEGEDENCNIS